MAEKMTHEWFEALKVKAEQGDASAQFLVAQCYLGYHDDKVEGLSKDTSAGEYWMRLAAEQGYLGACAGMIADFSEKISAREYVRYLDTLAQNKVDNGIAQTSMRLYAKAWFEAEKRLYCDDEKALNYALTAADDGDTEAAYFAVYLCCVSIQNHLDNHQIDKAIEMYKVRNKHKNTVLQKTPDDAERVRDTDVKLGRLMMETAANCNNRGEERQFIKLIECASEINGNAQIAYACHLYERAGKESGNFALEKYKKCIPMMLDGLEMEDIAVPLQCLAYEMLANANRLGRGIPVDMTQAYEYELKAAQLGSEQSKLLLPCYKKKLFGGYTFKIPRN